MIDIPMTYTPATSHADDKAALNAEIADLRARLAGAERQSANWKAMAELEGKERDEFRDRHAAAEKARDKKTAEADLLSRVLEEISNELGCKPDNEAVLLAVANLRATIAAQDAALAKAREPMEAAINILSISNYEPDNAIAKFLSNALAAIDAVKETQA